MRHSTNLDTTYKSKDHFNTSNTLIIHYTHEKRFSSFKHDMHLIYDSTFLQHIGHDIKLIVGNRNRRDSTRELITKRPKRYILTNNHSERRVSFFYQYSLQIYLLSSRKKPRNTVQIKINDRVYGFYKLHPICTAMSNEQDNN